METYTLAGLYNRFVLRLFPEAPYVLTNKSSGEIRAKEGDLANLICTAQGVIPVTFTWKKNQRIMESLNEKEKPHRSSFPVLTFKDQTSFGKYVWHIHNKFQSAVHTIWVHKLDDQGEVLSIPTFF